MSSLRAHAKSSRQQEGPRVLRARQSDALERRAISPTILRSQRTGSRQASCDARRKPLLLLTFVPALGGSCLSASAGVALGQQHPVAHDTNGRAVSPPGWVITSLHANVLEDSGRDDGGVTELYLRARDPGIDGPVHGARNERINLVVPRTKMDTGDEYFGRQDYHYWVEDLSIALPGGQY